MPCQIFVFIIKISSENEGNHTPLSLTSYSLWINNGLYLVSLSQDLLSVRKFCFPVSFLTRSTLWNLDTRDAQAVITQVNSVTSFLHLQEIVAQFIAIRLFKARITERLKEVLYVRIWSTNPIYVKNQYFYVVVGTYIQKKISSISLFILFLFIKNNKIVPTILHALNDHHTAVYACVNYHVESMSVTKALNKNTKNKIFIVTYRVLIAIYLNEA